MSKQTGGDMYEFREAPLLRLLAKKKLVWSLLLETPLGLYDPNYRVDLKEGGGTQKDRLNQTENTKPFSEQIARIVGLTDTEFPSEVRSVEVDLRTDPAATNDLLARITAVTTEEGRVAFDYPFTPNCLTFTQEIKSRLWLHHLRHLREREPFVFLQAATRIQSVCQQVRRHRNRATRKDTQTQVILENNLLLLSRYLEWLGIDLGVHVGGFPDQPDATVFFTGHGRMHRPIELKYDSRGYTRARYKTRPKGKEVVVLCFEHNDKVLLKGEDYLDVIDVNELGSFMFEQTRRTSSVEEAF
jgi:hypothetical protein